MRLSQRRLTSKQHPPSPEQEVGMESKSQRALVKVSELLHDVSRESCSIQREAMALLGMLLFFEAVS